MNSSGFKYQHNKRRKCMPSKKIYTNYNVLNIKWLLHTITRGQS